MKRHRILGNGLIILGFGVACLGLLGVTTTSADQPDPDHKVTICHRTASHTNPYVMISVDDDAVDGVAGNSGGQADHYGEHQGPIGPIPEGEWGDIIPPVPPHHTGLNWTAEGQAIWENDCTIPPPTTATPTTQAPTTQAPTTETPTTQTPTTAQSTTTSQASEGPTTTAAPSTTAVGGEGGGLPATGQERSMLVVAGVLSIFTGLTLRALARRTA